MQTDQEKRTLLAVGLCMFVYLVWMQFFAPPMDTVTPAVSVDDLSLTTEPLAPVDLTPVDSAPTPPGIPASEATEGTELAAPAPVVEAVQMIAPHSIDYETDAFVGEIHSTEGAFRGVSLKGYTKQPDVQPLWSWLMDGADGEWVSYQGGNEPEPLLTSEGGFVLAGAGAFTGDAPHRVIRDGDDVVATSRGKDGLSVTKRYVLGSDSQTVDVSIEFNNRSDRPVRDLWVGMADAPDGDESADRFANVVRPIAFVEDDVERVDDLADLNEAAYERFEGRVDWFGLGNKYFMSVLLPLEEPAGDWVVDKLSDGRVGSFLRLTTALDSGAKRTLRFRAYMGPKELDKTSAVGHNLDRSIEFGWFGMFAKILLSMLKFFHGLVGNWGVAILLLTCTVKAVFFPLMQKQFISSKRMQAIQPELKALKEKYKDNQQLQTQMTMQLFQENKVNPMSGCLPMIIQMPVWFALYNVMLYSVELYGTSFLYLKDLTEVDPTGFLPLMVTVLMVLQQKLMPMGSMDPMQQKMMRLMPVMFGIFMFTFPAGLVLYFSVNNVLTILQQWFIYRKKDDEVSTPAKA